MLNKINILLVDDREDGLVAMEAVLASEGYHLIKARTGHEALREIQEHDFAVILLDVQMPELNGFETAKYIRMYPPCKETPIIFVTAIGQDNKHIYEGYQSGAVDYIFKPLDDFILKSKIKVFVDLYRKNQRIREQSRLLQEMEVRAKERLKEELELESLRRYSNLANAIPHIVFKTAYDGKIEYANQVWYEDYAPDDFDIDNFNWQAVVHPDDHTKIIRHWLGKQNAGFFQVEARIKDKTSSYRWHLIRIVAEKKRDSIVGWLGTCTDIHDQKNKENEFRALTENLNRSNKELEEFAYVASHDLQEPLRKIITFTEIIHLSLKNLGQEEKEYFNRIYQAGYRMKAVIENLLQYSCLSRITEDKKEMLSLNAVIQEVLADLEVRIKNANARIDVASLPDVKGNPVQLRLLFQNLLSNAIKFSKKNVPPHIKIENTRLNDKEIEVRVSDNGIGIDEKYTEKIYQPFQRLHRKDEYEGTGIGLSIVKKIINYHDWKIRIESRIGVGTTFIITMPSLIEKRQEQAAMERV